MSVSRPNMWMRNRRPLNVIIQAVARSTCVRATEILSSSHCRAHVQPRQRVMLEAWLEGWSIAAIGKAIGRDRATVLYGIRKTIHRLMSMERRAMLSVRYVANEQSNLKQVSA